MEEERWGGVGKPTQADPERLVQEEIEVREGGGGGRKRTGAKSERHPKGRRK